MTNEYFLIVDYNNLTRVDDVRLMRDHLRERHGLATILIRPKPRSIDQEIADRVIDLQPRAADFAERAYELLRPFRAKLRGGIVFSDDAVEAGARLLEQLGLPVDDACLADAALSKLAYRSREQLHQELFAAQRVLVPEHLRINTADDVAACLKRHPEGVVVKPSCEGNSRGVAVLRPGDDLSDVLQAVAHYLVDGVICEEYIAYEREYSFDGIGPLWFITEKLSAPGRYPVETGQIVPARLSSVETQTIRRAGMLGNLLVGQCDGPFHNEIRLAADGTRAAIVEPNRRPAGMRIWHLAGAVYGVDFFRLWIDRALGLPLPDCLQLPTGRAAVIMLGVPPDGVLRVNRLAEAQHILEAEVAPTLRASNLIPDYLVLRWLDVRWLGADVDRVVRAIPRDNDDFIACASFHTDRTDLDLPAIVALIQDTWRRAIAPFIVNLRDSAVGGPIPASLTTRAFG